MSREPENTQAALAALADGTLPDRSRETLASGEHPRSGQQRESLLARVAESPELTAELEEQRRAVAIVRSLERVEAPPLLRRSIELAAAGEVATTGAAQFASQGATAAQTTRRERNRGQQRSRRRPSWLAVAGALAAAVAVVLVLALAGGGNASAPTVLQASSVGLRAATHTAPVENPHNPHLLAISAAGISYPYWDGKLGWSAAGSRTDSVGGRTVTTVFYNNDRGRRIGYSIVSGSALPTPAGSAVVRRHGIDFHVVSHAHPTVVSWREAGHTCILTARGVDTATLVHLATWERT
jgi:hypothetical protein